MGGLVRVARGGVLNLRRTVEDAMVNAKAVSQCLFAVLDHQVIRRK